MLKAKNGDLIGIAEERSPNTILVVHDFNSGQTWPGKCFYDSPEQCRKKGASLLENL
jgi:hypothetical protein